MNVLLAEGTNEAGEQVTMSGLELPRVMGISVSIGDPLPLSSLRGTATNERGRRSGNKAQDRSRAGHSRKLLRFLWMSTEQNFICLLGTARLGKLHLGGRRIFA